jgi:type I restriction enzyme R subunit
MFLTGFDSKTLNTLYVDKNLRHHGLIQAYSRTNRILGEKKSQGNIIVFRNLKKATDDAIALFSNKEAKEIIIMQPYDKYVKDINDAYQKLINIVPTFEAVDNLYSEDDELEFIKAFRAIIRLKNVIESYVDFSFDDIDLDEQEFENYKSKYLDLYDKTRDIKDKTSILDEVDFELELIHRDDITVSYILALLANLKATTNEEKERKQKEILDLVAGESKLRSKRELIEKFIIENLPLIQPENIEEDYNTYMNEEKQKAFNKFVEEEKLNSDKLKKLTEDYLFSQRTPTKQEVVDILENQPSIMQRAKVGDTILSKFMNFINTFFND